MLTTAPSPSAHTTDPQAAPMGVTAATGFRAAAVHAGIRAKSPDVALIVSDREASAAAVFTTNLAQAAPIVVCKESLATTCGKARAIVVNAGNANACTGEQGLEAARATAYRAGDLLGIPASEVLVASTGVIGQQLPLEKLLTVLPRAVAALTRGGGADAAVAILTTDLVVKECVRVVESGVGRYTIGGIAKGSGMIHPNMATTLAFVTTDAAIAPPILQQVLRHAVDYSFNRISVDGDTSTNDMVAILANGASGVEVGPGDPMFTAALTEVLLDLAKKVARDGEGATKLITVTVTGARSEAEALQVSRTIAGSPLVKTAVHGADANWGRVIAAAGRAGVDLDPGKLTIALGDVIVLTPGYHSAFDEQAAKAVLKQSDVTIAVDLGHGSSAASTWTCDLTPGYIAINASYRT